ncbi:ABC transporter permease [Streptomyces coelicoflavus]|uniref:ABC transporter permease n=1 Tax=Streptomyces coelicoflavus TaxID=285562 RepID=UPI0024ADCDB1|nr:ABC transporter permease [Streptomyces coelicoflavus]MDI6520354.1 ABC transporter permease [Streptomyces coelicoflavus]
MSAPWRAGVLGSQVAELLHRPGRSVATGLSLLIAAFAVFGAVMAQQILSATVVERFRGTPEATSLVVTTESDEGIDAAALRAIGELPSVAEAVARIDDGAALGGSAVSRYLQLSADPGSGPLATVRLVEGSYPVGPRALAVNEEAAREYGLAPGSRLTLLRPDPDDAARTVPVPVEVSGIVHGETTGSRVPTGYATGPRLERLLGLPGSFRVDVRTGPGAAVPDLARRIRQLVPEARVRPAGEVRDREAQEAVAEARDALDLVSVFLTVAVGAAALLAASSFRIVFARRVRQLALLRAVGATSRRLATALVAEGAAVGLVAGAAGVLAAWGCGLLAPLAAAHVGHPLSASADLPWTPAALTVLGTVLLAVMAVLAPSLTASRVSVLHALRIAAAGDDRRAGGVARTVLGLLCAAGAAVLAEQQYAGLPEPGSGDYDRFTALTALVVSGGLAFLSLVVLGRHLVRPVLAAVAVPLRRLGAVGRLSVAGVGGAPARAAAVSVVVALGVCLVGATLTCLASLSAYERYQQAITAPADFSVTGGDTEPLPAALVSALKSRPELAHATAFRTVEATVGDPTAGPGSVTVTDLAPDAVRSGGALAARTGSLDRLGPSRIVVDAEQAHRLGVRAGDRVSLGFGGRAHEFRVAATLPGTGLYGAQFLVTARDLTRMGAAPTPTEVIVDAADPGPRGRARAGRALTDIVDGSAGGGGRITVEGLGGPGDEGSDDLRTAATTAVLLLGLTVVVAVAGVATTAGLTVVERRREFGLLRALGLSASAVHRTVTLECALHGVLGGVLGLALGLPYAWLVVRVAEVSAPFSVPVGQLSVVFGALVLLTAVAGALPARRASRTSPVVAVAGAE